MKKIQALAFVSAVLAFTGCTKTSEHRKLPKVHSLVDGDSVNRRFSRVDAYLKKGEFAMATEAFNALAKNPRLSASEIEYAKLSETICAYAAARGNEPMNPIIASSRFQAMAYLLHGMQEMRNGRNPYPALIKARDGFNTRDSVITIYEIITLQQLGLYHRSFSVQIDSAFHYFSGALDLCHKVDSLEFFEATSLFQLGELSIMFRDIISALAYLQQMNPRILSEEWKGKYLNLKATLFRRQKQFDSSFHYYEQAKVNFKKAGKPDGFSEVLREQALQYILQHNDTSFFNTMRQLNAIDSLTRGRTVNLNRLYGYYYFVNHKPLQSIRHYEKAIGTLVSCKPYDAVQPGEALYLLIEQLSELKQFEKAEAYAYQLLALATPLQGEDFSWKNVFDPRLDQPHHFVTYGLLADVYRDHFYADRNYQHLEKSLRLCLYIDSLIMTHVKVKEEDAIINYLPYGHRAYSTGIEASYYLHQKTGDTAYLSKAHLLMEKSKSILIFRDLLARKKEYFPEVATKFMDEEMILKARLAELKRTAARQELTKTVTELRDYYSQMEREYPRYFRAKFQLEIPSYQYFQHISQIKDQSFLQYHTGEDAIYFLTYDSPPHFGQIKLDSILTRKLSELKNRTSRPPGSKKGDLTDLARLSNDLYVRLFAPAGKLKEKVLIIPEGITMQLPFEALVSGTPVGNNKVNYVNDSREISYAHSLKVFSLPSSRNDQKGLSLNRILAYAGAEEGGQKRKLSGAVAEVQALRTTLTNSSVTVRTSAQATKTRFLEDLEEPYDLIHIALHASSGFSSRYDNQIEFYNGKNQDATLYADELISKKLNAHTIILANCESASGTHVTGEGTYSLERTFSQMGASLVISSSWKLPDRSASEIMDKFYRNLKDRPGEAVSCLTMAKREYLVNADEYLAHPFFWASLLCFENQRGVPE